MKGLEALGLSRPALPHKSGTDTEFVQVQWVLRRVLAFTRRSIDDVVNDPIARKEVAGYYKLHRLIERRGEVVELERQ